MSRRRRWQIMLARFTTFLLVFLASQLLTTEPGGRDDLPPVCSCFDLQGFNGLWLKYTWYFGSYPAGDVRKLADRLCAGQFRYAYFHVRYITQSGRLRFHFSNEARTLLHSLRPLAPAVREIAWIYAGNLRGAGHVNLHDPAVRNAMVEEARWLVVACGFDGVQWDYEACPDGDPDFLLLLQETRAALPAGSLLGVASPLWRAEPRLRWGWSDGYYRQVAARADQLAVMCYDTGLRTADRYQARVREQVLRVGAAAAAVNPECKVLLGVPAYQDPRPWHHPEVENTRVALEAITTASAGAGKLPRRPDGVALFADYSASAGDWDAYRKLWAQP